METKEIFKDIKGYEGQYQISNYGRVKSLKRECLKHDGVRTVPEKYLKISHKRYSRVCLNHSENHSIHRLVAGAFLLNSDNKTQINHINGIKTDNKVENLEWVNSFENNSHSKKLKTSKYVGVSFYKKSKKWRAGSSLNGKNITLGYFLTEEEAYERYKLFLLENNIVNKYASYVFLKH